jgi:hypothetical protein
MTEELQKLKEAIIQWYGPRCTEDYDEESVQIWEAYDKLSDFYEFMKNPMTWR